MDKGLRCDICRIPISIHFPLHDCKPSFSDLVRLVPNYDNLTETEQARWIESVQYGLNRGHKPEWYDEYKVTVERLVSKHGIHLIYNG